MPLCRKPLIDEIWVFYLRKHNWWFWIVFCAICTSVVIYVTSEYGYVSRYAGETSTVLIIRTIFYDFLCDKNNTDLETTLLAFNEQVPDIEQLKIIETNARQYLKNIQMQISETMEVDTELMLTGSTAERCGIPFSDLLQFFYSRRCISFLNILFFNFAPILKLLGVKSRFSYFAKLFNVRHAVLTDFDYMIVQKNEMVSFNEGEQKYQASIAEFPFYNIKEGEEEFHANTPKSYLLKMAEKFDVSLIPWHLSYREPSSFLFLSINGPALTMIMGSMRLFCIAPNFYSDITYSLKCPEWPDISDWGQRENTKWPNPEQIELIKSVGCHFIPKSKCLNGTTWRISFSKAEVELSKLVPTAARLCLVGLKIIRKDHLAVVCSKLKSYHLKCILLNAIENDPDIWKEDNLRFCFEHLLKCLKICLANETAPFYWLSTVNLFDQFTKNDFKKLNKQLERVEKNPSKFIEPLIMRYTFDLVEPGEPEELV